MPRKDSSQNNRKRGKDKSIERYKRYGKFTGKALRQKEASIAITTKTTNSALNQT